MMDKKSLSKALFSPEKVALIGASTDSKKNSARPQRYLAKHGFLGKVFVVNSKQKLVQGVASFKDVKSLPEDVSHIFIMVPAEQVKPIIEQAVLKKIKVATIYSDGFGERNKKGLEKQEELVQIAKQGGMRLLGPNSMGIINTTSKLTLSVSGVLEFPSLLKGNIGLVSQSGTVLGAVLSRGRSRNIGFSKLISVGNESDLGVGELADLLIDDPQTDTILLFLEVIRDPVSIAKMARRAFTKKKPVIVYKLGRSEIGRKLAFTHSGAITGDDRCVQAFFNHNGIIRVNMLDHLIEAPALFKSRMPAKGRRVSVVTTTGGGAAMIMDRLGKEGLDLVGPPKILRKKLSSLGVNIGKGPLIDLTMAGTKKGVFGFVLSQIIDYVDCNAIVAVVGSSGLVSPDVAIDPIVNLDCKGKFLAVFIAPEAPDSLKILSMADVAVFRTPEACSHAVKAALSWGSPKIEIPLPAKVKKADSLLTDRREYDQRDAGEIFARLGIPQSKYWIIQHDQIPRIEFPVAIKILAAKIPHKSDLNGVMLNIKNLLELRKAMRIISSSAKQVRGLKSFKYLIQPMQYGVGEVLLGYKYDQEIGPVVILGTGGQYTEIFNDAVARLAPVSLSAAKDMIKEVRGLRLIRGYRSNPKGDLNALAKAIVNMSKLVCFKEPKVLEAEINPLIVKADGQGVVGVDALIYRE